jgi:hypothetical protein
MTDERVKQIDKLVEGLRLVKEKQDKNPSRPIMARAEEILIEIWDAFKTMRGRV